MYNGTFNSGVFDGQGTWFGDAGHSFEVRRSIIDRSRYKVNSYLI